MPDMPMTFLKGPWRQSMGLAALDLDDWLWPDERYDEEMVEREALLERRPDDVLAGLPGSEDAAAEVLELVAAWLLERAPGHVRRGEEGATLRCGAAGRTVRLDDPLPLRAAARLVQEDLCVMERTGDGDSPYALTAAALCFPAHWRLREKVGLPLDAIHAPVPGFRERLGAPAHRFFAALAEDRPVWRANWTVVETPGLHHPGPRGPLPPGLSPENAGELLWLRVERQTLRRLPRSRAVLFTIRTLVRRLGDVVRGPEAAAAMAARVREMEPGAAAYKGLPELGPALLPWLDRRAGG